MKKVNVSASPVKPDSEEKFKELFNTLSVTEKAELVRDLRNMLMNQLKETHETLSIAEKTLNSNNG